MFVSPKLRPHSTPNILDLNDDEASSNFTLVSPVPGESNGPAEQEKSNANSELTLMEENLSGYCEPFGSALMTKVMMFCTTLKEMDKGDVAILSHLKLDGCFLPQFASR